MKSGFDAIVDLTRYVSILQEKGYAFVCRYYNVNNPSKNLTLGEAHLLSSAGIGIVAVWENGFPTSASYFTYDRGVYDGVCAYFYALHSINQPVATPIYFTVDYDALKADIDDIIVYFKGIQNAFNSIGEAHPRYNIGVYGSGLVCSAVLHTEIATFTWLAQSPGWQGSSTFSNYNIRQTAGAAAIPRPGDIRGDQNASPQGNEGSFKVFAV